MATKGRLQLLLAVLTVVVVAACGSEDQTQQTSLSGPTDAGSTTVPAATSTADSGADPTTTAAPTTTSVAPMGEVSFESLEGIHTISDFSGFTSSGMGLWEESVSGIQDIRITSTADGTEQPALWLPPQGDQERPLLVILHSWSSGYLQHAGIPYAMWARENGWAVIAPEFRGVNDHAEAIGSDLAVQDVVDAIDHATAQEGVSSERVFAVGYSGGGMMSLLLAGRHPEKVKAVAAWGPPYDLLRFYEEGLQSGRHYAPDIEAGCGGDPRDGGAVEEECLHRSPMTHLDAAREQGVAVFLGQGIADSILSPSHSARAFNQLAEPDAQFSEEELELIGGGDLSEDLAVVDAETYFGDGDPEPVLARQSAHALLVLFNADHEMVYGASTRWFATDPG